MEIRLLDFIEGAQAAEGLTVIIDVFRAFSLEAYLMSRGTEKIYAVGSEETARALKAEHPDYVLLGERKGKILPGFDFGNSPSQTKDADLSGKTCIHTTSAGTQGLVNATHASEIVTGSLVNAKAIANYIKVKNPEKVSLVGMGLAGKSKADEDVLCERYIESLLLDNPLDMNEELTELCLKPQSQKFFDPAHQDVFPVQDYVMCTLVDRFDFVLKVKKITDDIFEVTKA